MRSESNAQTDRSAVLDTEVAPSAPWRVTHVAALPDFRLRVTFVDGVSGIVDLANLVQSPKAGVFAALADPSFFSRVFLEYGAVAWPGNLDLAPDAMHEEIQKNGAWVL